MFWLPYIIAVLVFAAIALFAIIEFHHAEGPTKTQRFQNELVIWVVVCGFILLFICAFQSVVYALFPESIALQIAYMICSQAAGSFLYKALFCRLERTDEAEERHDARYAPPSRRGPVI